MVVDERVPAGEVNPNMLYDKITAKERYNLPYYIAGAFDRNTLPLGAQRRINLGDGEVYGGYLNYPLEKGKEYSWFFVPHWRIGDKPVWGVLHQGKHCLLFCILVYRLVFMLFLFCFVQNYLLFSRQSDTEYPLGHGGS